MHAAKWKPPKHTGSPARNNHHTDLHAETDCMSPENPAHSQTSRNRDGLDDLLGFAVDAARRAGALTLRWFQYRALEVSTKSDGTPVTAADLAAERLLRELIADRYPDDAVLGEEIDGTAGRSGRTWVIDPIDGTKAFTQGVPLYATLLALVDRHGPAVGVIYLPALDECVSAGRGRGTHWNGKPCQVSSREDLRGGYVCTSGMSYWPEDALSRVRRAGARIRTWGDAYGYALVATGRAEAMIDPECAVWDVAPMSVIISEAGGRFTDTAGIDHWRSGSALGSNNGVHQQLLECFNGSTPTAQTPE